MRATGAKSIWNSGAASELVYSKKLIHPTQMDLTKVCQRCDGNMEAKDQNLSTLESRVLFLEREIARQESE